MEAKKIQRAYAQAAKLVQLYGEKYLPIFERLHQEIQIIRQKDNLHKLAATLDYDIHT